MRNPFRFEFQIAKLESYAQFGRRSASRDTQDLIQRGMIDSLGLTRQAIEVLAQDLALQEDCSNAEVLLLNLGRNEVLISLVLLRLGDASDWSLVDITARSGGGILGDEDFRTRCIWCCNRERDFVSEGDVRNETAGQKKFCLIRKHAGGWIRSAFNAHHTLAAHRNGRAGRCKGHAVGGQYRTALRKCKTPLRT